MNVCPSCFEQPGLGRRIAEIRSESPDWRRCDTHPTKKGVPVEAIAGFVDTVFRQTYVRGRYDPRIDDFMGESLWTALEEVTGYADQRIGQALYETLRGADLYYPEIEESFYSDDASYEVDEERLQRHSLLWRSVCKRLVHGQRFFNPAVRAQLEQIFTGIHRQRDTDGRPAVYTLSPGGEDAVFHRARLADDYEVRKRIHWRPARELGPPPPRRRTSGRLNPSGVAVFYGAFDLDTCHAELRPAVGSLVVSAQFELIRPITVLDTTRFAAPARHHDLYAKNALEQTGQWLFMRSFMEEIAKPILPGEEHLDYVPTQAVAEYLTHHHAFPLRGEQRRIDAIVYQSAQTGRGRNIALLGAAAVVEQPADDPIPFEDAFPDFDPSEWDWDDAPVAVPFLRLVSDSVEDRRIERATVNTEPHVDTYPPAPPPSARHDDL